MNGIFLDAGGWQPFQPAFNLMPFAGGTAVVFGIVNLAQGHTAAGWVQVIGGLGFLLVGVLIK